MALAGRPQRFVLRSGSEANDPSAGFCAERTGRASLAILAAEISQNERTAGGIHTFFPGRRGVALRTPHLLLLPIDDELVEVIGALHLGLPSVIRTRRADEGNPVPLLAGDE